MINIFIHFNNALAFKSNLNILCLFSCYLNPLITGNNLCPGVKLFQTQELSELTGNNWFLWLLRSVMSDGQCQGQSLISLCFVSVNKYSNFLLPPPQLPIHNFCWLVQPYTINFPTSKCYLFVHYLRSNN